MKLKRKIYNKLSQLFSSDVVDTEQEIDVADAEITQEASKPKVNYAETSEGRIMAAFRDAVGATPIEKLHWSSVGGKENAYIKHIEGSFSLNNDGKHWKLEILINEHSSYNRKLESDEYVMLIYKDLHTRIDEYVVDFLKQKPKDQADSSGEQA